MKKENIIKYWDVSKNISPKIEFYKYAIKRLLGNKEIWFSENVSMKCDEFLFNCGKAIDNCKVASCLYEKETIKFVLNYAPCIFLDIGCNIGKFSILANKVGHEVIAIDGDPNTMKLFKENIKLNSCENMEHYCCVCLDEIKEVKFYRNALHSVNSSITENEMNKGDPIILKTNTINNLIGLREIGLIKVDAEGFDLEVLKGTERIIKTFKPTIIFEGYANDGSHSKNVEDYLKSLGYEINFNGENYIAEFQDEKQI